MITKKITFEDFNGDTHTAEYQFHLSKTELAKLEAKTQNGLPLHKHLENLMKKNDTNALLLFFIDFVTAAYGVKSEDGMSFKKNPEITEAFISSPAFDSFFMDLMQDEKLLEEFVQGVMPKDLAAQAQAKAKAQIEAAK